MRIKVLNTFLNGRDRFTEGELREIPDEVGLTAVANGWAEDMAGRVATGKPKQASADLVVDKINIGVSDNNG